MALLGWRALGEPVAAPIVVDIDVVIETAAGLEAGLAVQPFRNHGAATLLEEMPPPQAAAEAAVGHVVLRRTREIRKEVRSDRFTIGPSWFTIT